MNAAYNEISCADAARMIGVEYSSVAKLCKAGRINCVNVSGGTERARYVIKEDEVEYIKQLRQKFGKDYLKKYRKDWRIGKMPADQFSKTDYAIAKTEPVLPAVKPIAPVKSTATIKSIVTNITTEKSDKVDIDEIAIKIGYIQDIKDKIEKLEQEKQRLVEEYDKLRAEVINAL